MLCKNYFDNCYNLTIHIIRKDIAEINTDFQLWILLMRQQIK